MFASGPVQAQQFTYTNIADENTVAPGKSDDFTDAVGTSLSGHTVAFGASYAVPIRGSGGTVDYGIYTANTTGAPMVSRVADDTTIPQGGSQNTVIITGPAISGSNLTFVGADASANFGYSRIYTATAGMTGATLVANLSTAVPGQSGQTFTSFNPSAISGSNVVFGGAYSGGAGLYLNTYGTTTISRVVDASSTFGSGQTAGFTFVASTSVSGSTASFSTIYNHSATDSNLTLDGVFTATINSSPGLTLQAGTTTAVPGRAGLTFTGFGNSTLTGSKLLFAAAYNGGNGIYQLTLGGSGPGLVADTSTTVPGQGVTTFTRFGSFSTNGTDVVFTGSYGSTGGGSSGVDTLLDPRATSPGAGIFLESNGNLFNVISTGDILFGSTVQTVSVGGFDGNELAFSYILANGQAGVAVADLVVPEPSTSVGCVLLLGAMGLTLRRRARRA